MKIAIVGKCPGSRYLAPFNDDAWTIWTFSPTKDLRQTPPIYSDLPRWDEWFELHDLQYTEGIVPGYTKWLGEQNKRIWLTKANAKIKSGVPYPLAEITQKHGRYFTNTVSWVIALAIHRGAKEIAVYGVDMAQGGEYAHQRPSCEYWLGYAAGKGIDIYIPDESDLLKCRLYGFDQYNSDMARKIRARKQELESRHTEQEAEEKKFSELYFMAAGGLTELQWISGKLNGTAPKDFENRQKNLKNTMEQCATARENARDFKNRLSGAQENLEWADQWS